MKDETLLPCPFCGGKAEFDYDDDGLNWVSCSTCGVSTDTAYHTDVDARETLRDVWNSRALQSGNSAQPVTVPEKLPLDYLQGQKDGLEWAAQMAEASHPQTGDWLYDDPIELAKAIRKGPDMPNHDNTLVIPDGLIPAINRLLDSDGSRGRYSAIQCYDAREEVERLLAAAPTAPDGWIPVSERMPDKLIPVMVMYEDGDMWSAIWGGQFWDDGCAIPDPHSITHWRDMPDAPKGV